MSGLCGGFNQIISYRLDWRSAFPGRFPQSGWHVIHPFKNGYLGGVTDALVEL